MKHFGNYVMSSSLGISAAALVLTTSVSYASEAGNKEANALITRNIQPYLIEHGYCRDRADCLKKELVFFNDGYKSVRIDIYQADQKIIEGLPSRILSERAVLRKTVTYEINFYQLAHKDAIPQVLKRPKSICTITFVGEQ